ncbi:MAG: hypothetical protein O3A10_01655 [Chloroflexi bacterium]|nr:hypothetical protein [Chloroflexota bacterium]MDA1145971.1 hypothetical protein [Chloroflexota bacterium]
MNSPWLVAIVGPPAVNSTREHPFPWPKHHLRIDNTQLDPATAATRAHEHFGLPSPADR